MLNIAMTHTIVTGVASSDPCIKRDRCLRVRDARGFDSRIPKTCAIRVELSGVVRDRPFSRAYATLSPRQDLHFAVLAPLRLLHRQR